MQSNLTTDAAVGKFGTLQRVDLRLLWPHEALDFTPWLAKNLSLLGDTLGLDLELRLQESPVGAFSLDLLAHDLGSDRTVIIENQIGPTDHDHLGKLLTYAAGHDAAVAIWIASAFRDEHRQALDWLNGRTDASTEFFGIVVEALKIDDSRPACNFRLVATPNDWRKSNVTSGSSKPSVRGEAYRAFFQVLIDQLREDHHFTNATKAQPNSWYSFASGISGIAYACSFSLGARIRVEVYIDRGERDWNKSLFDALYSQRDEIEAAFDESVEWERLDEKRASRIAIYRAGSIDEPAHVLEDINGWALDRLLRLKDIFGPRIAPLIAGQ